MKPRRIETPRGLLAAWLLPAGLLLASCSTDVRVGQLRTESQSVEPAGEESVRVEIEFGAGDLHLAGGAADLMKADFTYNVDELKPEVEYADGTLVVRQPEVRRFTVDVLGRMRDFFGALRRVVIGGVHQDPANLLGIEGFRNEWDLRFSDQVPMELTVSMGAGTTDLELAGLPLSRLAVSLGAVSGTLDLSGDWARDLDVSIETGAADLTLRLPRDVGVRVEVEAGPTAISAPDMTQDGNVYTNAAYGVSPVTLDIRIQAGIGRVNLEVEE